MCASLTCALAVCVFVACKRKWVKMQNNMLLCDCFRAGSGHYTSYAIHEGKNTLADSFCSL